MPRSRSARVRLLTAAAACAVVLAGVVAASASAAPYGELKRFGANGKTAGKFTSSQAVHALGVDTSDGNSVYVGDEPKEGEFRIQKFTAAGEPVASVTEKFPKESERIVAMQGIAVDPALKRVYALIVYERAGEEAGGLVDTEEPAAGILYAFSTTPTGKELVPATGAPGGVLASESVLHAQSEVVGKPSESALLEPSGIAVDPNTGDVVILGQEDKGSEERLVALQRVHSNGTLGARWVDTTECFEGEGSPACTDEEGSSVGATPTSPVVTAGGKVLVELESNLWEIPAATGEAPRLILRFNNPLQNLIEFPGLPEPAEGGGMAYEHEAGEGINEGTLFATASVVRTVNGTQQHVPAAVQIKLAESGGSIKASEVGWTGGVSKTEHEACAISISGTPSIGVGTKRTLFLFDSAIPTTDEEREGKSKNPHVDAFGEGGTECPTASADGPVAKLGTTEVGTEKSPILAGQKVSLSSKVSQANALDVEWDFGDGTPVVTESAYQFEASRIEHAFTGTGTRTVKETIHTDNLATPTIVKEAKLVVAPALPTAQFSGPSKVAPGSVATFDGKGSSDPNNSPIRKYVWNFGDGTAEVTTTVSSVSHTYTAEGTHTVSLKVTDELGLTSAAVTHAIVVAAETSGGGGGGGPTPTPTPTPTPSPTPPGPAPGGGVLPLQVHKAPDAKLASSQLTVSAAGGLPVKVSCPAGASCTGAITLSTIGAVSASVPGHAAKKAVLTLATASFTVSGGSVKVIVLHLSAKARKLLAKTHTLKAKATILSHDSSGASHTDVSTVTLKLAKKSAHH